MGEVIDYRPARTISEFIKDYSPGELFYDWIVGPVGSGKTSGIFFKLIYMAKLQARGKDGYRRTRAVVVRNTAPQLKDTTLVSWNYWFKDEQAGHWDATNKNFTLRFDDVICEVLFRPLDTPQDIARVLSLEITFAIVDEFVKLPREIIDALSARVGRYPPKKDGGPTNWGMWGSSNPDTEDCWWFDYLVNNPGIRQFSHGYYEEETTWRARCAFQDVEPLNVKYFLQPSGFSKEAENLDNLVPGYYTQQAKGKSHAWCMQFIAAEWGFSMSGKAVISSFNASMHVASRPLLFNPLLPLVAGVDPGLGMSAVVFMQTTLSGRLNVLSECVQTGYGAMRLIKEVIKPHLARRYPNARVLIAPDPAANNRSNNDERTIVDSFKKEFGRESVRIETNNRLPLRVDAIEHFTTKNVEGFPALQIDARECPQLVRGLKGGWRWALDTKKEDNVKTEYPEDNPYTHPCDAFGYGARFFYKSIEATVRRGPASFVPPKNFSARSYHMK